MDLVGFAFLKTSLGYTLPYGFKQNTLVLLWTTTLSHLRGFNDGTYIWGFNQNISYDYI